MPSNSHHGAQGAAGSVRGLARIEKRLLAEQRELSVRARDGYSPTTPPEAHRQPSENAIDDVAHDLEFHKRQSVFARLADIDAALGRLRAGSYGVCTDCSQPIAAKRLDHDAAAALCIECQSAAERPRRRPTM